MTDQQETTIALQAVYACVAVLLRSDFQRREMTGLRQPDRAVERYGWQPAAAIAGGLAPG
jgi:hypothetical protein